MTQSIRSGSTLTHVVRTLAPAFDPWSRYNTAISDSSTFALPPRISAPLSRIGRTDSTLARIASLDCQAVVAMQRPEDRSANKDKPAYPSSPWSAGITSSLTCVMPASIDDGCATMVVLRAYTEGD